jgi:hypothetical protein
MTNWMPRVLGAMMLRPGTEYIGITHDNARAKYLPFIFSTDDTALIEFTDSLLRVWVDDELLTRVSVSTATTNGNFTSNITGWTDDSESGGSALHLSPGYLLLNGTGAAAGIVYQQVTVSGGDANKEHALRVVIAQGPVVIKIGSTNGGEEYFPKTYLGTGTHSLAFTPTDNFYIQFSNRRDYNVYVDSCNVEAAGAFTLTSPYELNDLRKIRYDQSGDVLFLACEETRQRKLIRYNATSWGLQNYSPEDGPFRLSNTDGITIAAANLSGDVTLTASAPLFKPSNVGSLYRLTSNGQTVAATVTAEDQFSDPIRVTGVENTRIFTVVRSGTWVADVTLQRSVFSEEGPWEDATTYSNNASVTYDDGLDNQIIWYRIGVKAGDFTSGTISLTLRYSVGSIDGIVEIDGYSSPTSVSANVLKNLGGTDATDDWAEGAWSDRRGYPTSVALVEGRLAWAGKANIWLSVSDAYESFDEEFEGDAGPISRSIGSGPVDDINWLLALNRLVIGADGAEFTCKSSALDEPLTPTAFSLRPSSNQGSGPVAAAKIDKRGVFVNRSGVKLYEISPSEDDYDAEDLTALNPDIGAPEIVVIAVQRQPDTRIHCIRSDGTACILIYDALEEVTCWTDYETDGLVEDVVILPGSIEDRVYYQINRDGIRCLEKWALESECQGGTLNKQADSFVVSSGSAIVSELDRHNGKVVVAWGDGKDLGSYTVSGGAITLSEAVPAIIGLPYAAPWKSSKLGNYLTQRKILTHLGVILRNTHYQGLKYGPDFDHLDDLPLVEKGLIATSDLVRETYDEEAFEFPGEWASDARLCLQAQAPLPCTILAAVLPLQSNEKS